MITQGELPTLCQPDAVEVPCSDYIAALTRWAEAGAVIVGVETVPSRLGSWRLILTWPEGAARGNRKSE